MMHQQTFDKLHALRWLALAEAWRQQMENPEVASLSFDERFSLLVDQHWTWRENQAMAPRLKRSKLDTEACVEDIDCRHPRGLDRALMRTLSHSQWVAQHHSLLFTGPTGTGKSWLAQALAQKACRDGYTVWYRRVPKLFRELMIARADGSLGRVLESLARIDVLVVDDFAMAPLNEQERRDFLEICDDRYNRRSTILTSQLPVEKWHAQIGDPTVADSILDRLVHHAYRIELCGESLRKKKGRGSSESPTEGGACTLPA
jgi:DNA replication protein DnaC